jgi:hypothetical protein
MIDAGANALVAGSAVFKSKSYKDGAPQGWSIVIGLAYCHLLLLLLL